MVGKNNGRSISVSAVLMAAAMAVTAGPLNAAVLDYDTSATSGLQTGTGTWNFNSTADWSTNGASLVPWTSNSDTAAIVLAGDSSTGVLTVDNTAGQVGAAGLNFSGSTGSGGTWALAGDTLQLGAGGIRHVNTNGTLTISAPLQLTASQTWTSNKSSSNVFVVSGPISSQAGHTTNLTFDGLSAGTNAGDAVTFNLAGTNSFSGSTTVTGSATLKLDYTTNNTQKLDPNSSLILNNGKIILNGGTFTESVASTSLVAGQNFINSTPNGVQSVLKLGTITRSVGATLDVGTNVVPVIISNANTDGSFAGGPSHILGGWATAFNGSSWIGSKGDGVTGGSGATVAATNGSTFTTTTGWSSTSNVKYTTTGASSISADTSANVLQLSVTGITLNIDPAATLTLASGGLMDAGGGNTITGGKITTGMSTGELFVYAPKTTGFTIDSQIVDNGSTPLVLVKGGQNDGGGAAKTLTLTGANTYTGKTYVNSGKLLLSGSAVGTVTGGLAVATNATFDPGAAFTVGTGKTVSGGGTILNSVDASGATINPGDSTGAINIQGGLTLDANSILNFDFNDLASGLANDKIVLGTAATRALVLDGTLDVNNLGGLAVGKYTLISGFTSLTDNGLNLFAPGIDGTISSDANGVYLNVSAVPEPATLSVLALGGLGLLRRRRRRV